jgi:hypothetical protein
VAEVLGDLWKWPKCLEAYGSGRSAQRLMKVAEVSGTKSAIGI